MFSAIQTSERPYEQIQAVSAALSDFPEIISIYRGEAEESIVLPGIPFDISRKRLIVPGSPLVMPPRYLDEYVKGREKIRKLHKRHNKGAAEVHDMVHSAMVLFLALSIIQAGKIKLSTKELAQLSEAIVYHDIGRSNDGIDRGMVR